MIREHIVRKEKKLIQEEQRKTVKPNGHSISTMIAIPDSSGSKFIEIEKIIYCESSKNVVSFYCDDTKRFYTSNKTMTMLSDLLKEHCFFRIHNRYLINTKKVISVKKGKTACVVMSNSVELPISFDIKNELFQLLKKQVLCF